MSIGDRGSPDTRARTLGEKRSPAWTEPWEQSLRDHPSDRCSRRRRSGSTSDSRAGCRQRTRSRRCVSDLGMPTEKILGAAPARSARELRGRQTEPYERPPVHPDRVGVRVIENIGCPVGRLSRLPCSLPAGAGRAPQPFGGGTRRGDTTSYRNDRRRDAYFERRTLPRGYASVRLEPEERRDRHRSCDRRRWLDR